jgi:hypothetical protein
MTTFADSSNPPRSVSRFRGWFPVISISLLISVVMVSPFFWLGTASGHDFEFHADSWLDVAGQWKEGVLYPRWAEWANHGFGEPRFIFYPPSSWMLGAALGSVLPWNAVPIVFIVLVQTFSGLSAFPLVRRILPERATLFCVACYVANPYALLIVYMRSDFAELLANAFFPLLFLAALRICDALEGEERFVEQSYDKAVVFFAVVFAAVWLSNAPAGVIASYSSALVFGFFALSRKSWQPLIRGGAGLALGFGLTGFYLLPAAYEQRWVNIGQALSTGLLPSENFLFTTINDPEHTLFNWIVSSIAVLTLTLAGLAAIGAKRRNENRGGTLEARLWQMLLLLAATATLLMLRFTSPLWTLLPKLRFVQFPWRWMSLLAVPFAIFLGLAMARKRWGWAWALVTFSCIGATGVVLVQRGWWDKDDIPVLRESIANQDGYDGTDEYDPTGDDHTNILTKAPQEMVMDTDTMQGPKLRPSVHVDRWSPEEKGVSVSAREPFWLGLRLLNYPAWRVELNGAPVTPRGGEDYNQMIVRVPAGDSRVRVRFQKTWDRTVGGLASLGSLLITIGLWKRRRSS